MKEWDTQTFLTRDNQYSPNALIILNTPLPHDKLFRQIWAAASVRYCADGGANRLYQRYARQLQPRRGPASSANDDDDEDDDADTFLPDMIKGDLDSLKPQVRDYYASKGVPILHDSDQDSTDLGKCVDALVRLEIASIETDPSLGQHQLVILGGLSGRLDQTVHTLHALMQLDSDTASTNPNPSSDQTTRKRARTWAVGRDSIACVLGRGSHRIETSLEWFGDTCGILPVGEPAHVTTRGLKWDLGPESYFYPTSVAHCVSSSNHLPQETVEVDTDTAIVWTVEVRQPEEVEHEGGGDAEQ